MVQIFLAFKNIFHAFLSIIVALPIIATMCLPEDSDAKIIPNPDAENPYINEYKDPDISAHRSGAGIAPQNTLMAFQKVLEENSELGVDTFEFDVQITKDGELIILHNLTYDDTSNAEEAFGHSLVYASALTFEEAQVLNLGENFEIDGEYPYRGLRGDDIPENLRVVKCEDVIDYIEKNSNGKKYRYIIENKSIGIWGAKAADKLYEIITERNLQDRVIWATSKPLVSVYMAEKYPDMPRSSSVIEALQFYVYCRMDWDLDDVSPEYVALQIPYGNSAAKGLLNSGTKEITNYAHKYDIAVQYWTINEAEDVKTLTENGADCIMTDYPEMAFDTVKECQ